MNTNDRSIQPIRTRRLRLSRVRFGGLLMAALCMLPALAVAHPVTTAAPKCEREIKAYVVALEQVYYYNRFGSFNPSGMMYALRRDVVDEDSNQPISLVPNKEDDVRLAGHVQLREGKRPRPLILRANEGDCLEVVFTNLLSKSTSGQDSFKDPATGGFSVMDSEEPATRYASMHANGLEYAGKPADYGSKLSFDANVGRPTTDAHNNKDNRCSSSAAQFGENLCVLAAPGESRTYRWYAKQEGGYLFYSMAGPAGGEGDGGQLGLGLFGSINVQPRGTKWYRSQVTKRELDLASDQDLKNKHPYGQPIINYEATFPPKYEAKNDKEKHYAQPLDPILNMLRCFKHGTKQGDCKEGEIIYSDLNAVIDNSTAGEGCANPKIFPQLQEGNSCGKPYREFTSIFHDEMTAVQAYPELENEANPLSALRDGMGINYGAGGLGPMVMANQKGIGPAKNCKECKLEEFFLTSWANGDPAMVLQEDPKTGQMKALYPDDPSNVHHSYMGDPVRFRNMHAGPKETHVFHLHAHQWVQDKHDPDSVYLDSQTISPGAVFSYEVHYGGSGNRNKTVGDSIFHCHLYPHFAQGMWELWRSHDVFENGSEERKLPDGEISEGTPNPAIVPVPRTPLPPMPTQKFKGYPFYIAGQAGHRPPQPPKDLDLDPVTNQAYGGLPRHRILSATLEDKAAVQHDVIDGNRSVCQPGAAGDLYNKGKQDSACNANSVYARSHDDGFFALAGKLKSARVELFKNVNGNDGTPNDGTPEEKVAMDFHSGKLRDGTIKPATIKPATKNEYQWPVKGYSTCDSAGNCDVPENRVLFPVNGRREQPGAPYADPCPDAFNIADDPVTLREYKAAYIQFDMTVNKSGWHDPQARIAVLEEDVKATLDGTRPAEPLFFRAKSGQCVVFKATNLIPSTLNLDDYQVFSPTDVIGQHIHLVKFDVTSSDGSGNGWNYEDGTLAADEVRERIVANNLYQISVGGNQIVVPQTHRIFKEGSMKDDPRGNCDDQLPVGAKLRDPEAWKKWAEIAAKDHPWCGAQTTIQRWWADPLLNGKPKLVNGKPKPGLRDRTLRTVFTHDHFGPSSHQHHGLYAALVVEPTRSKWETLDGEQELGTRPDGGPTSYAANIIVTDKNGKTDKEHTAREFNLAFADYALVYTAENQAINPPNRVDGELPSPSLHTGLPLPEGISTKDPGTQLINYRNEPIPLRIGEKKSVARDAKVDAPFSCAYTTAGKDCFAQRADEQGDMANVFSSTVHKDQPEATTIYTESLKEGRKPGDPATPILRMYDKDNVQIRLIQGAQEENHIFTMHGGKWLSQPESPSSGYMNAQPIGISEHFEANVKIHSPSRLIGTDYLYSSSATDNLWDGQWGILRSFAPLTPYKTAGLAPLYPEDRAAERYSMSPQEKDLYRKDLEKIGIDVENPEHMKDIPIENLRRWQKFEDGRFHTLNESFYGAAQSLKRANDSSADNGQRRASVCKPDRDMILDRPINVTAWHARDILPKGKLTYNAHFGITDPNAILFVVDPADDLTIEQKKNALKQEYASEQRVPEPLILRARAGDCMQVTLYNALGDMPDADLNDARHWSFNTMPQTVEGFNFNQFRSSAQVSLHPQLLAVHSFRDDGAYVGVNKPSTAKPCATAPGKDCSGMRYEWYAGDYSSDENGLPRWTPIEFGGVALRDMADVIKHSSHGAIGALVVEPANSQWGNSCGENGTDKFKKTEAMKDICDAKGKVLFRDFVLLYQDDLSLQWRGGAMANLRNADDAEDTGAKAFNYRTEPIWARLGAVPSAEPELMMEYDWSNVFNSTVSHAGCQADPSNGKFCDPETPLFTAPAGMPVRFRVLHPGGHPRNHAFTLFGHDWIMNPFECNDDQRLGSTVMGWNQYSQSRFGSASGIGPARHINILTTAGGAFHIPGDYMYRTQEGFNFAGGLWGIFRVTPEQGNWHAAKPPKYCQYKGASVAQP